MPTAAPSPAAKWLLSIVVAVSCLGAMEMGLRLISPLQRFVNAGRAFHRFDPQVGWRGRPDIDQRFVSGTGDFDVRVRHDHDGFRALESPPAPAGAPVWAFLGDSFTWGWGVDQGEAFTDRLQGMLGGRVAVRNLGINATSTLQQALLLEQLVGEGFRPARVVVMMFANDFAECVLASNDKPYLVVEDGRVTLANHPVADSHYNEGWWRRVSRRSALLTTISYVADIWRRKLFEPGALMQVGSPTPVSETQRVAMRFALARIRSVCDAVGAEVVVALVPLPAEVAASQPTPVQAASSELAKEAGFRWLDLTPGIRAASGGDAMRLYFRRDAHWNPEGHRVAAEVLRAALDQ